MKFHEKFFHVVELLLVHVAGRTDGLNEASSLFSEPFCEQQLRIVGKL